MNDTARWSSSSGLLGGWPAAPKLSGVGTRPRPNRCSQTRLTHHAGRQRVVLRRDPVGQLAAGRCRRRCRGCFVVEHLRQAAADRLARLVDLAADVDRAVRGADAVRGRPSPAASACRPPRTRSSWLCSVAIWMLQRRCRWMTASCPVSFAICSCRSCDLLLDAARAASADERLERPAAAGVLRQLDQRARLVALDDADRAVARLGAAEDAGQGVVVLLRDRVELVVVAAGAGDREPEERLRRRVDLLVDHVHLELPAVALVVRLRADRQEAGGDQRARPSAWSSVAGSRSPASCSRTNWSYGLSALKAAMT